jgi:hypothetical protein
MGGASAPDDLLEGCLTQVELSAPPRSSGLSAVDGSYLHHRHIVKYDRRAKKVELQNGFLAAYREISAVPFPR